MNRKTLSVALMSMVCGALASGAALAKDDHFKMMDTNNDGKISAAEHAAGVTKMFTGMDTDKDGFVTATEMDAYASMKWKDKDGMKDKSGKDMKSGDMKSDQGMEHDGMHDEGRMSSSEKIATMDTDGDGKLSSAEHDAGAAKMFTEMDTDKDGSISHAEMEAGMKMKMKHDDHATMDHSKMGHDAAAPAKPADKPADANGN